MPDNIGYYGWTVPEEIDAPNGPVQFAELATDIEATVRAIDLRLGVLEAPPFVRCRKTAAQNFLSSNTPAALTYPLKDEDPSGMANAAGDQFTAKKAGVWSVSASMAWGPNVTGPRWLGIYLGATPTTGGYQIADGRNAIATAAWNTPMAVSTVLRLAVNNIICVGAGQTSGVALDTSTAYQGLFNMVWLRP